MSLMAKNACLAKSRYTSGLGHDSRARWTICVSGISALCGQHVRFLDGTKIRTENQRKANKKKKRIHETVGPRKRVKILNTNEGIPIRQTEHQRSPAAPKADCSAACEVWWIDRATQELLRTSQKDTTTI